MAGPGGAYGHMNYGTGPVPGQGPTPQMQKPGTVAGIQVILWIFSAISAIGELLSIISLVEYFSVFGLLGVALAGFFTVKSILAPIYIGRGRRWAWILGLIGAILGTLAGTAMVFIGAMNIDVAPFILLIGLPYLALYITLLSLLCTSSARMWITSHRVMHMAMQQQAMGMAAPGIPGQPGAQPQPGMAGNDPQAVAAAMMTMMKRDPSKRPGVYVVLLVFGIITLVASAVIGASVIRGFVDLNNFIGELPPSLAARYYVSMGIYGTVLLLMAVCCILLARKASAAGIMSIVGGSIATALLLGNFVYSRMMAFGGPIWFETHDPLAFLSGLFGILIIPVAITFMILSFIPSTRQWLKHINGHSAGPTMPGVYPGAPMPGGHTMGTPPQADPYQQYPPQGGPSPY